MNAKLSAFFPAVPGEFFVAIALDQVVGEFLFGKANYFVAELLLFFAPREIQSLRPSIQVWESSLALFGATP